MLSETLAAKALTTRLRSDKFRRKKLSRLYLDQHFLAGVGNYLRSEILFEAELHPDLTPADLTDEQLNTLSEASLEIAKRSYKTQGYTVPEDIWRNALQTGADFEQSRFMVFDRDGQPCRVCVMPIERLERNGRRLYWCPTCQAKYSAN